jgi:hypothetical protein
MSSESPWTSGEISEALSGELVGESSAGEMPDRLPVSLNAESGKHDVGVRK